VNVSTLATPNILTTAPRTTHVTRLDLNENGFTSYGEVLQSDDTVLETAEPNAPIVDRFDANNDGFVTVSDINNTRGEPVGNTSLTVDPSVTSYRTSLTVLSSASEATSPIATFQNVQSGGVQGAPLVDVYA